MKRHFKALSRILAVFLVAISVFMLTDKLPAQAAAKKTVRVTTQKELNKALKNSKVGTVILRTDSYDPFTIFSKKAKKKSIIIDCPNSVIENKAKFKAITLENAKKYTENVSGNTIYSYNYFDDNNCSFVVAANKSVKKLVMYYPPLVDSMFYIVQKGASIKELTIENQGNKSTFDKKTNTVTLNTYDFEDSDYDVTYTFTLDKDGRVLKHTMMGKFWNDTFEYTYDESGNYTQIVRSNPDNSYCNYTYRFEFVPNTTLISAFYNLNDDFCGNTDYYYDKDNVLVEKIVYSGLSAYRSSYAYDKNGRLEYEDCIFYEIVNGDELVEDGMNSRSYKYDKKGNRIEELTYTQWGNSFKTTYKYDKNGNKVLIINESDGDIDEMKLEYDEYGNNEGMYTKDENGNWQKLQAG